MYSYLPHTDNSRKQMLDELKLASTEDLFANIPSEIRIKKDMNLPEGISELEARKKLVELASNNRTDYISFLGGGVYNRYIPACILAIIERSEFITAYTPYQPEVSQGTLQVIYEYQTMICNLTGMDAANASVYDGGVACAEAVLMACRLTNKSTVLLSKALNPEYKAVVETYCYGEGIDIEYLPVKDGKTSISSLNIPENKDKYACILLQTPNYLGCVENVIGIADVCGNINSKFVVCADPVSFALLKSPGNYGADIVVGDVQPLGLGMSFGGPHGGYIACKSQYLRQLPGRIVGMTKDRDGDRAFTLTLQTREQHIKRAKATSNICTNQALMALAATVYLSVTGPEGLKEIATISAKRARYLAVNIDKIPGFKVMHSDFINEFVVKVENIELDKLYEELKANGILAGIKLENDFDEYNNCLLLAVTEMNSLDDVNKLIECLKTLSKKYNLVSSGV